MRSIFVVAMVVLASAVANAQEQKFVPFTVDQNDLQQLDTMFLNSPPRSYQQVVSSWITGLEQRAVAKEKPEATTKDTGVPAKK